MVAVAGFLWGLSRNFRHPHGAASAPASPHDPTYITEKVLAEALERLEISLDQRIDHNVTKAFARQSLAIESLREMIADTDLLLERVLRRLEVPAGQFDGDDDSRASVQ